MSSGKAQSLAPHVVTLPGVAIVGAGLAGCLLAVYLRRRGVEVDIFESRVDMRAAGAERGRSINLVLTSRGLDALNRVNLLEKVISVCTPVFGRTLHSQAGDLAFQAYGPDASFANYSISRTDLNVLLLDAAEAAGARVHFQHALDHLDVRNRTLFTYVRHEGHPHAKAFKAAHVFGTDGAGSRVRQAIKLSLGDRCADKGTPLGASYKELLLPARPDGSFAIDKDSLHIWPRGSHFLMALPNLDGSFTMTLYLPDKGDTVSFAALDTPEKVSAYFQTHYPDVLPHMPDLAQQWAANPQGFLGTVSCAPWHAGDAALVLGDAAHAVTPFFGQGCNASFEGVVALDAALTAANGGRARGMGNVGEAFAAFFRRYKPNADAIAQMAVENYYEMMDKTGDAHFLAQKALEIKLAHKFPETYLARYALVRRRNAYRLFQLLLLSLLLLLLLPLRPNTPSHACMPAFFTFFQVTHTLVPYAACKAIGEAQQLILDQLCPPSKVEAATTAAAAAAAAATKVGESGKKAADDLDERVRISLITHLPLLTSAFHLLPLFSTSAHSLSVPLICFVFHVAVCTAQLASSLIKSILVPVLRRHHVTARSFADVSRQLVLKAKGGKESAPERLTAKL
jgi:kynurenine 3-monooxygenase